MEPSMNWSPKSTRGDRKRSEGLVDNGIGQSCFASSPSLTYACPSIFQSLHEVYLNARPILRRSPRPAGRHRGEDGPYLRQLINSYQGCLISLPNLQSLTGRDHVFSWGGASALCL